jgi:hypothetical protein
MFKKLIVAAALFIAIAAQAATLTFVITVPDAQQTRAMTALRTHYTTTDANGNPVVPTQAQAIASFRQAVAAAFKDIVLRVERDAATAAAAAGVTPVDSQ